MLVGDIHLRHDNLDIANVMMESILLELQSDKYVSVVFMGDIFDVKGIIRIEVQNFFYRWVNKLLEIVPVRVLVGNHDMVGFHGSEHAFRFLNDIECNADFAVYDKPAYTYCILGAHSMLIIYAPYYKDANQFVEDVNTQVQSIFQNFNGSKSTPVILLCHQEFRGFFLNGRIKSVDETGVDQSLLDSRITQIFSGHIHILQDRDRVQYVGVPFTHNFGEANEWTGYFRVWSDAGRLNYDYFDLSNIPKHIQYEVLVKDGEIRWESIDFVHKDTDMVKFVVHGSKDECLAVAKLSSILDKLKNIRVPMPRQTAVKYVFNDRSHQNDVGIDESMNHIAMFDKYVKLNYDSTMAADLIKIGTKIITSIDHNAS